MSVVLRWAARRGVPALAALSLLAAFLLLSEHAAPDVLATTRVPSATPALPAAPQTVFLLFSVTDATPGRAGTGAAPDSASFSFDKRVMLRSEFDQAGCTGGSNSLTVYYGTLVAYCYIFTNTGSTTFVTHTLTDDKLGSTGTVSVNVPPGGQIGLAGLPPDGLTEDTTNTASWTATDEFGTGVSRSDRVTVRVVAPLTGFVFVDQNGDGARQSNETTGINDVTVTLDSQPATSGNRRQTKTNAQGYYQFLDVVEGPSTVSIPLPPGYVATSPTSVAIDLVSGIAKTVNFGVRQATPTPRPTSTSTYTSAPTNTPTHTPIVTFTPTITLTLEPSVTPTATFTETPGPTQTETPTETPTETTTPTPTETATLTPTPSLTPSPPPTATVFSIPKIYLPLLLHLSGNLRPPLAPSLMPIPTPGNRTSYVLSWTPIYDASAYDLERSADSNFDVIEHLYSGDKANYSARSSGIGLFYYRVRSRNPAGASPWSSEQTTFLNWETEPNNTLAEANGALASNVTVYGLANDANDFFQFTTSQAGPIIVRVDKLVGQVLRLALYRDNIGTLIAADAMPPFEVGAYAPAGNYYVRVFVGGGYSTDTPYQLLLSYP